MAITEFRGDHAFLSNFYPVVITMDGKVYPTVEHAFQASKTTIPSEREAIRRARTPKEAKRLGRAATMRMDWTKIRLAVMGMLVKQKFTENEDLKEALLATGDEELVEENTWNDTYWGVSHGTGKNHLGRLLMQVRKELKNGN